MYFFKNHLYQFIYLKKRKQSKKKEKRKETGCVCNQGVYKGGLMRLMLAETRWSCKVFSKFIVILKLSATVSLVVQLHISALKM